MLQRAKDSEKTLLTRRMDRIINEHAYATENIEIVVAFKFWMISGDQLNNEKNAHR